MIKQGNEYKLLAVLCVQQGLFLAIGLGLWIWSGREAGEFLGPIWFGLGLGLALAAAMIGLEMLLLRLWPQWGERMALEMSRTVFSTERPYGWAAILIISFGAGIGEEALFRGGVQMLAGDYMPGWAAVLAATILFTLLHPGSRTFMVGIATVSLILGTAYHLTGSLLAVIIAHALFDVFSCHCTQRELKRLGHWPPAEVRTGTAAAT